MGLHQEDHGLLFKGSYNCYSSPLLGACEATHGIESFIPEEETGEGPEGLPSWLEAPLQGLKYITSEESLKELGLFIPSKEQPKG